MAKADLGDLPIIIPYQAVQWDLDAFDALIQKHGIQMYHYKAVQCPVGMSDAMDVRSPHYEHANCSNGYIYKLAGIAQVAFTSNSVSSNLTEAGMIDGSTVMVTFPRYYTDKPETQIYVQTMDRFYIKDVAVMTSDTQLFEAHVQGIDKLTYKAEQVEYLIDSQGKEYTQDVDFLVEDGRIRWLGPNRPQFDVNLNKGQICAIKYLYTPYFYVSRIMHEVRFGHTTDYLSGETKPLRAQYNALLSREYWQYKKERSEAPQDNDRRTAFGPATSIFGPK